MSKRAIQDKSPFAPNENCPHCGKMTIVGFGLAGGGFGPYTFCEECNRVVSKSPDIEEFDNFNWSRIEDEK